MPLFKSFLRNRTFSTKQAIHLKAASPFWNLSSEKLFTVLETSQNGLLSEEANARLQQYGLNAITSEQKATPLKLLIGQFKSPLVLILIFAALVSIFLGELTDAAIVLMVVLGSTLLGFFQEFRASNAVEKLRSQLTIKSNVLRDGKTASIPSDQLVPGDVVLLSAGSLIPADGVVLETNGLFVNQAVLTGETFPVEKNTINAPLKSSLAERQNCVFMGTSVRSGTARALVVHTGKKTIFGEVAQRLNLRPDETEFERGIRQFGNLLTQVMTVMVLFVLVANLLFHKPLIDSLLFSLALAVGLAPELLPAIISVTLAQGAQRMAKHGVIVRRLNSIENFGSMDILCTDKTGTLTQGVVHLDAAMDLQGNSSEEILRMAYLNAFFQTGLENALDEAIQSAAKVANLAVPIEKKVAEIPYDFVRKRLSVFVSNQQGKTMLITKGALEPILNICTSVREKDRITSLNNAVRAQIERRYAEWSEQGFRVLGLAIGQKDAAGKAFTQKEEKELSFIGFLLFFDPPKEDVTQVISDLARRGVQIKIITGDNEKVARHIAQAVNLPVTGVLTGTQLDEMHEEALWHLAESTTLFAEVDPNQKERIVLALKKTGHVVGYMGDGINDAPALHAADVGISVNTAVDVAKEAADFVLLEKDLTILREGISQGRVTFANTLKYILTTISANFGNMFSMAGASILLPFLPLLAPQILLNNFLSDIPGITVASDNVDDYWIMKPHRWDTRFIRNYMVLFGLVSSIFDFLTFGILLFLFKASPVEFRTGWFIESLLTELVIALVVRTRLPFYRSRPSKLLLGSSLICIAITLILPFLPVSAIFGFTPLPFPLMLTLIGMTMLYILAAEIAKRFFYTRLVAQEPKPA